MTAKTKKYLDYVPLLILIGSAVHLLWVISTHDFGLFPKQYIGLSFLAITIILFIYRHLFGVLFLGLTMFLGTVGILALSATVVTWSFGWQTFTLIKFQPLFSVWFTIYIIISGKYYVGILSKEYWEKVKNKDR